MGYTCGKIGAFMGRRGWVVLPCAPVALVFSGCLAVVFLLPFLVFFILDFSRAIFVFLLVIEPKSTRVFCAARCWKFWKILI
jgi:hypothetical protein